MEGVCEEGTHGRRGRAGVYVEWENDGLEVGAVEVEVVEIAVPDWTVEERGIGD